MYIAAKIAEASGLTIILIGFLKNFPNLMSHQLLLLGVVVFACGWVIENFLLKH